MPLGELPVGYPRGPPISSRDAKLHHRSSTRNGVHFLRHLVTDTAEAPHHFTLFALPIEPVLTVRFWSAATDGTVRSWLCHTSLLGLPAGQLVSASRAAVTCPVSPGADGTAGLTAATATAAAAGTSGLSREAVGAFIAEKAAVFARETATLRGEVSQRTQEVAALQARNRVLADALKSAIARINQGEGTTNASPLPRPPTPVPVDVTDGAARIDAMRATLEELHGKLHDAYADKEQLLADRTAMQLRLSERASLSATTKVCRSASVPAESRHGLAAREGRGQMERLQEQLAMCQMECSMYVRHWRSEYMRRVAVVAEREACEERLATLQKELDHARAAIDFSSLPLQQRQQQLLQQQQPQSSFPTVTGDTQSGGDASDAAQTDAKLFWPTESMGLLVGVGVGEGDGDGNRSEANKDSVSDDDYDTGRALEGLAFYCGALSGGSAATPQGAGTAQTDLHEREQRLAAALRHLKDAWQRIKRTREVVETKAKRVRHAQKQLIAKEATLLEHAERLRALEEELRRKERRLMREGRGSQQGCCCCCSTCNLTTRCRCPKEEGGNAFAHICRART
ncbi:hypothetical protein DQ04_17261000 [Trypanosoma grayi]|uniref:hypothetical protein n=1 Tax=Trypanosoma grayi TaxID=71804 RepID=UPI0004F4748C|nr:hypothetical protein DQ04_17261000 [Trypanosoma grayi]KEG05925.1 hypothetical protein DQ04_17261000 [Trypanosoma grayi]